MARKPLATKPQYHNARKITKVDTGMANRLRLRRTELGVSQDELGKALGVSFQQIQKYEKGTNRIGAARLQQIAEVLRVPVTFFYESNGKEVREVESMLALDASYGLRLLRAYTSVKDLVVRRHFVSLIESVAGM